MVNFRKESHPHLIKRGMLNMINKLDLSPCSFTLLYTQMVFLFKKKKGGRGRGLSNLVFVEDCMDDWKSSII